MNAQVFICWRFSETDAGSKKITHAGSRTYIQYPLSEFHLDQMLSVGINKLLAAFWLGVGPNVWAELLRLFYRVKTYF